MSPSTQAGKAGLPGQIEAANPSGPAARTVDGDIDAPIASLPLESLLFNLTTSICNC